MAGGQIVVAGLDAPGSAGSTSGPLQSPVEDVGPEFMALLVDPGDLLVGTRGNHKGGKVSVDLVVPFSAQTGDDITKRVKTGNDALTGADGAVESTGSESAGVPLLAVLHVAVVAYHE
jgi:hypothetical protein